MNRLAAALKDLRDGAVDTYRQGREDHRNAFYSARKEKDLDNTDAPWWEYTTGTNPTFIRTRELLNQTDPIDQQVRRELQMDLLHLEHLCTGTRSFYRDNVQLLRHLMQYIQVY